MPASPSPIKLNGFSKTKLRTGQSPPRIRRKSPVYNNKSLEGQSMHTIPSKLSPTHKKVTSNLSFNDKSLNNIRNKMNLRTGSPLKVRMAQTNLPFIRSAVQENRMYMSSTLNSNQNSPVTRYNAVQSFESPQRKPNIKESSVIIKSPSKFPNTPISQVVDFRVSARQAELERKVKILESRISQLHIEKGQLQFHLNEQIVRFQHQNNFLKRRVNEEVQRANARSSKEASQQVNHRLNRVQTVQSEDQSHLNMNFTQSMNIGKNNNSRILKDLEKSEEQEYVQSKQIHALKANLNEVEDMLSSEISKSLQLLEELQSKQAENEQIAQQLKQTKKKCQNLEKRYLEMETKYSSLQAEKQKILAELQEAQKQLIQSKEKLQLNEKDKVELRNQLERIQKELQLNIQQMQRMESQIQESSKGTENTNITKELMLQLEQNNQVLINAVKSSQQKIKELQHQLSQLQQEKNWLKDELNMLNNDKQDEQNNVLQVKARYDQNMSERAALIQELDKAQATKETVIQQQIMLIKKKSEQIQSYKAKISHLQEQLEKREEVISTSSSFYRKAANKNQPCDKCDQLRKTIFKLNTHLNKSNGFASTEYVSSKNIVE